jgi:uncharacterized membrane protein
MELRSLFGGIGRRAGDRPKREEGVILVLWVVALTAILAFVGLAIDMGNNVQSATNIQDAADAAAIAGATQLYNTALPSFQAQEQAATSLVEGIAAKYGITAKWDDASCTLPTTGDFVEAPSPIGVTCIAFDQTGQTIWVEIAAQDVPSLFGSTGGSTMEREAYASASSGQAELCYTGTPTPPTPGECS